MKSLNVFPLRSWVLLFFLSMVPVNGAFARGWGDDDWHMMGPGMMYGGGMGWFGGIVMILFWILVIVGLVFLIRWLIQNTQTGSGNGDGGSSGKPLEVLKQRYAAGEIDKQEFEEKKKDLLS